VRPAEAGGFTCARARSPPRPSKKKKKGGRALTAQQGIQQRAVQNALTSKFYKITLCPSLSFIFSPGLKISFFAPVFWERNS
jgi:hypothetical protein